MSYSKDRQLNDIVRNVEDTKIEAQARWRAALEPTAESRTECAEYNAALDDRAAERRADRELAKTGRTVALNLPFSRNRATRRHPAPVLNFEPNPNTEWRGRRMFLQRDKKRTEGRGVRIFVDEFAE